MRCSSFNSSLDELVDGTLGEIRHARVSAHVASCPECASLLAELRVIDALLIVPRTVDPAPNFTFAVMAEVRDMRAPHAHHRFSLASIAAYIVFAWLAIAGFLFFGGHTARLALASVASEFTGAAHRSGLLAGAVGHVFGTQTIGVTAAMGALLGVDVVVAGCVFAAFGYVRARRLAAERRFD